MFLELFMVLPKVEPSSNFVPRFQLYDELKLTSGVIQLNTGILFIGIFHEKSKFCWKANGVPRFLILCHTESFHASYSVGYKSLLTGEYGCRISALVAELKEA